MLNKVVVGVDYSMTGPSMTVHVGNSWSFKNCKIYTLTGTKKYHSTFLNKQLRCSDFKSSMNNEQRFDQISDHFIDIIKTLDKPIVAIENYSFASKGKQFTIGENTAILKHKLYKNNIFFEVFAPKEVKKYVISGKADKTDMYNVFYAETSVDLKSVLGYTKNVIDSPIADIVDSYYIAKYLYVTLGNKSNEN